MKKLLLIISIIYLSACKEHEQHNLIESQKNLEKPFESQSYETDMDKQVMPKGQLSNDLVPEHVFLDLTIVPDDQYFRGTTKIKAVVNIPRKGFHIHGNLLEVNKVQLITEKGITIDGNYEQVDDTGIAYLSFAELIEKGPVTLMLSYKAPFNEALEGLYKVKDGGINYAFTQFESISARLAFPSFDEPAFKVPYDISLTVRKDHVAISNTPIKKETDIGSGMKRVDYVTTKPLPSYLIAFAVGEFDVVKWSDLPITKVRNRSIPLSGLATKGKGGKLTYALENTQAILESLENYFNIPYPYAKLDIIAVPDFSAGAMENAGAITYREQLLLLDDDASQAQKRRYMGVHAHELAHQWFGNLVTPYWWNDIWLNEAFATWMSYTSLQSVYPEQNFDQTIIQRSLRAMDSDALVSARKIRNEISSNHDISSAFDGITYSKGGGVLEMMKTFLTPEQFRKGIQNYMNKFAFKNATADDFIAAISEAAENIPSEVITLSFKSFLEQSGIPFLHLENQCNDGLNRISLKQERYLPLGSKGNLERSWNIPACFSYDINGEKHQDCQMINQQTQQFTLAGTGCAEYIMPNTSGAGYYRYALSATDWQQLYQNLDALGAKEIISLNDSFTASVESGKIDLETFMQVAPVVIDSSLNNVATAPMDLIKFLKSKVAKTDEQEQKLSVLANKLYKNKFDELGFQSRDNDTVEDKKLRSSVINFMAITGQHESTRQKLTQMAKVYTGYEGDGQLHEDKVDANLIALALRVAVEDLPHQFTEHMVNLFDQTTDGTTRGWMLRALANSKDPVFNTEIREWILSDRLRDNEIFTIFYAHAYDNDKKLDMWKWLRSNFDAFKNRLPTWVQGRMSYVGGNFCQEDHKQELLAYFNPIIESLSGGPRALAQTSESIDLCIAKRAYFIPMLQSYLTEIDE